MQRISQSVENAVTRKNKQPGGAIKVEWMVSVRQDIMKAFKNKYPQYFSQETKRGRELQTPKTFADVIASQSIITNY